MKVPEKITRYCPTCKKHTKQSVAVAKQKGRSATHPLSRFSNSRLRSRSLRMGYGNKGKYSKPAIKNWKRKSKSTRKLVIMYTCSICKKSKGIKKGIRTSRLEIGEKVAK